jgi:hypothetical protein
MNKRQRKKAVKKLIVEAENTTAAGGRRGKKVPRISARERRIGETALRKHHTAEVMAASKTGLGSQGQETSSN